MRAYPVNAHTHYIQISGAPSYPLKMGGVCGHVDHHAIAECGDPEVAEEFLPISHLVFSNLKTWLNGIHHGVSAKHLQAYLNEFTFRFNRRFYPFNAFRSLLGIAGDAAAPTYAELYSGQWQHPRSLSEKSRTVWRFLGESDSACT